MPDRPNFPIPADIHAELYCLCLQIPNDPTWKSVVAGLLYELQYWFNWQRDDANSGKECAAVWKEIYKNIDWSTMSCCCEEQAPITFRFTVDLVLQVSRDGGETWEDAPGFDPRLNSPQFPPMTGDDGDDKKCIAATGAAALIKAQVAEQLTDDMGRYTLEQLLKDWTKLMINSGGNIFQTLLTIASNQIFAIGITALIAALTDPVWETLKCILYCNMEDDASFSTVEGVTTDIGEQIGGIATLFLQQLINLLGTGGLTNLARAGGATEGDCDGCECEPCIDECTTMWTFYNVHDVDTDGCNTYTMLRDGDPAHVAFSSGDQSIGCYCDVGSIGIYSAWPVGSPDPVGGTNPKTTPIWNFDTYGGTPDELVTFVFSSAVIP